jgi:hypothetical protein
VNNSGVLALCVTLVVGVAFLISLGVAADNTEWTRDDHGCYLRVEHKRSVWWGDDGNRTVRRTYCPEGVTP